MRAHLVALAVSLAAAVSTYGPAQTPTTLGCTDTGTGYLYCLPAPGADSNRNENPRERMNRESVQRGINALVPPQPSPQELAERAVGLAIASNPQQSGEDQLDYTIRVTRIARDGIYQRSPQAAGILLNRLVELENMKLQRGSTK